jgi:hypothetical protein
LKCKNKIKDVKTKVVKRGGGGGASPQLPSLSHSSIQKSPLFATKGKRIIMIMIQTNQQANQQTNKASSTSSYCCLEYSDQQQHF